MVLWPRSAGTSVALLALVGALLAVPAMGQRLPVPDFELPAPRPLPAPDGKKADESPKLPAPLTFQVAPPADGVAVSLIDVLRVASLANLDIVQARLAIDRARVAQLRAAVQILPNLNVGSTYINHFGQIQRTEGNVITVNRDSLFVGGGPSLTVGFTNVIFGPAEAQRLLAAARFGQRRVINDTLLRVAETYIVVLQQRRRLARVDEALDFLASTEKREIRGNTRGLVHLIRDFVELGKGLPADLARVEVDIVRLQEERARILQELRIASAELARLLHLPPQYFLLPAEDFRGPLVLPGEDWLSLPLEDLVAQALQNRPELAENRALIEAALVRLRAAKWRPLIPNAVLNYNWGGYGGGPAALPGTNTIIGHEGVIAAFGTRTDFDVSLIWRLDNMGLGNFYEQRDRRIQHEQAVVQQFFLQDRVMTQVVQALEEVQRSWERVQITRQGLFDANGRPNGPVYRSIRLTYLRIFAGEAFPLEALDSTRRLSDVLESYSNALSDYDRARFRLLIALGMPAEAILDPRLMPVAPCRPAPPAPVAPPVARGTSDGPPGLTYPSPDAPPRQLPPVPAPGRPSGDGWQTSSPARPAPSSSGRPGP